MDVSKREHGEVLPLKVMTYMAVSASLVTLLITFIILAILQQLRSNLHSIHKNLVASIFLAQLLFLSGINQTDNAFMCTVVAMLLHYSWMCTFGWMFVEGLHIYRMLTEIRNINQGHMTFYYAIGWGFPAIITGLAVGLDPQGYGNPDFCWLSVHDTLIWSMAGPIAVVILVNMVVFALAGRAVCRQSRWSLDKSGAISALRLATLLLLLVSATWLLGLMAVNSDVISFHYLFAVFSCLQGLCIFLFHCIFNKEVRNNLKEVFFGRKSIKEELISSRAAMLTRSLNGKRSFMDDDGLYRTAIGESTVSLEKSCRSGRSKSSHDREDSGLRRTSSGSAKNSYGDSSLFLHKRSKRDESDSDSDLSLDDHSSNYASSDSEEDKRRGRTQRWNNERRLEQSTALGEVRTNHTEPYWPVEPSVASEGEEPIRVETLRVETKVSVELHPDTKRTVGSLGTSPQVEGGKKESALHGSSPNSNHQSEKRRGILKHRIIYPPPVADKNLKNRLREKLSDYTSPTISPQTPLVPPSPTNRGHRQVVAGGNVLLKLPPRPPMSPRQQHNGFTVVTTLLTTPAVNGTEVDHNADSDDSNETSI